MYEDVFRYCTGLANVPVFDPVSLFPAFGTYAEALLDAAAARLLREPYAELREYKHAVRDIGNMIVSSILPFTAERLACEQPGFDLELCSTVPRGEWEVCVRMAGDASGFVREFWSAQSALRNRRRAHEFESQLRARLSKQWLHWKAKYLEAVGQHLAGKGVERTAPAARVLNTSRHAPQFPNRASWLKERLRERSWNKHDLAGYGGPDHKTAQKVLNGFPVREDVLQKVADGLSKGKVNGAAVTVSVLAIPPD